MWCILQLVIQHNNSQKSHLFLSGASFQALKAVMAWSRHSCTPEKHAHDTAFCRLYWSSIGSSKCSSRPMAVYRGNTRSLTYLCRKNVTLNLKNSLNLPINKQKKITCCEKINKNNTLPYGALISYNHIVQTFPSQQHNPGLSFRVYLEGTVASCVG